MHRLASGVLRLPQRPVTARRPLSIAKRLEHRFDKTKADPNKHASMEQQKTLENMHQDMKEAMQKTTERLEAVEQRPKGVIAQISQNPGRKSRYNQALWNTAGSFLLVIFAAQSLRSGSERKKANQRADGYAQVAEDKRTILQSLMEADSWRPLAKEIAGGNAQNASQQTTGWFGSTTNTTATTWSEDEILERITREMRRRVQAAVVSDDDRDALLVAGLQNKADLLDRQQNDQQQQQQQPYGVNDSPAKGNDDELLQVLNAVQTEENADGETVIKKRVFSI